MAPPSLARHHEEKERVRDACDIVRIIGEHVSLKAHGREYLCLCPFHDDHKPSMTVVPSKQIFHCFVCQTGGDVFSFVEKFHSMEFREALEYLADRAGITLTRGRPAEPESPSQETAAISRADLVRANGMAAAFFRTILRHPEHGRVAREVIERRGIAPAMVEAFALGASPDRWEGLRLTLERQDVDLRAFVAAGLLKRRESDNSFYDAFRNRLMFPIHDQIGRIIAFGARKINQEDEPKYLNSPESALFEKSGTLYGLHQAARSIQTTRIAIITEGYTDTIACHQAGITNVVATLGTALTARHASILRRLCETVILLFDGDEAGQKAADRAVEVFFAQDIDVRIATLASVTDAKDPDELLKREGGDAILRQALERATDLLAFRYERIRRRLAGAGMSAMSRAIEEELAQLVRLGLNSLPMLRRRLIVKRIAAIAGVDEQTIFSSIPGGRRNEAAGPAAPLAAPLHLSMREHVLACILCEPAIWNTLTDAQREELDPELFERPAAAAVAHAIFELAASGDWTFTDLCTALDDSEARSFATALLMRLEALIEGDAARLAGYLADCQAAMEAQAGRQAPGPPAAAGTLANPFDPAPVQALDPVSLEAIRRRRAALGDNRRVIPGARTG
jgi:DNA primase